MNKVRQAVPIAVFAVVALFSVSLPASAAGSSIKVHNKSKWEIHHLYLSPTSETDEWGPDQLGEEVIKTGGTFTLTDIECNKYDIKIADEDGDECVVNAVSLCNDAAVWNITDDRLLKCEKKSQ